MPRTLAAIVADQAAALQAGAVSSQLDPRTVVAFATLTVEALGVIAARLDAIDPDAAAEVAAEVDTIATGAAELAGEINRERMRLDALRADTDAAAAALQTLRGQIEATGQVKA